jgi:hypothetical protein
MFALRDELEGLKSDEIRSKLKEYIKNFRRERDLTVYENEKRIFDPPGLRTIQRVLKLLIKEKLVERNGKKYILTLAAHDVRYWSRDLGTSALISAAKCFFPTVSLLYQNVDNLVNLFGSYVLFCFMQISKRNPALKLKLDEYDQKNDQDRIRALAEIDRMTLEAVNNLFAPEEMYRMFLGTMKAQPTEKEVLDTIENRFEKLDSGKAVYIDNQGKRSSPPSIDYFRYKHWQYEVTKASAYEKTFSTIYELDWKIVSEIEREFKRRNQYIYESMMSSSSRLLPS